MKGIRASILFVSALLFLASLPVQAKDKDKLTCFGFDQVTSVVSEGKVSVTPSGRTSCSGRIQKGSFYLFVLGRPESMPLVGTQTAEVNYNIDANGVGLYWGKWSIDFGEYGFFEGNYSGNFIPFFDHTDGFAFKLMLIGQNGQLQGTFHGADGDEEWLIKAISTVSETGAFDDGMDYFGEIFVK